MAYRSSSCTIRSNTEESRYVSIQWCHHQTAKHSAVNGHATKSRQTSFEHHWDEWTWHSLLGSRLPSFPWECRNEWRLQHGTYGVQFDQNLFGSNSTETTSSDSSWRVSKNHPRSRSTNVASEIIVAVGFQTASEGTRWGLWRNDMGESCLRVSERCGEIRHWLERLSRL